MAIPKDKVSTETAWQQPSSSAFDFRSRYLLRAVTTLFNDLPGDGGTTATPAMLQAVINARLDDSWNEGGMTSLESHVAHLTGRACSLLVVSGTMGNQLAFRTHLTQPPMAVLMDSRSHTLENEAGGIATLSGALVQPVMPSNGVYLTLEDIKKHIVLAEDQCSCPTRVIHLENTLGGTIMPLEETRRISEFARTEGVKVHCDGARLWDAVAAGAGSLTDFCALYDSVSLCFTKGLGASVGSILVGEREFIKRAKWLRKSIGGSMRQPGIVAAAARAALDEAFGADPTGEQSLLKRAHAHAARIATSWQSFGGKLTLPAQTNMVWLDLEAAGLNILQWEQLGREHGLKLRGPRLVTHYRALLNLPKLPNFIFTNPYKLENSNEAVQTLIDLMGEVLKLDRKSIPVVNSSIARHEHDMAAR